MKIPPRTIPAVPRSAAAAPLLLGLLLLASCGKRPGERSSIDVDSDITKVVSHRVVEGETWEGIADDFYGDPARAGEIAQYNNMDSEIALKTGDLIQVPLTVVDISTVRERKRARRPYNEGLDLAARRQWVEAAAKFKESLELDPGFFDARYNLALTYQKMGYHERAIVELFPIPEDHRGDKKVYFARGNSLFYLEDYEHAAEAFRRALEIDPEFAKAQYSLAYTLEKLEDTEGAIRAWRRYLEIDSSGEWAEEAKRNLDRLMQN